MKKFRIQFKDIFLVLGFGDAMCLMACAPAYTKPEGYLLPRPMISNN